MMLKMAARSDLPTVLGWKFKGNGQVSMGNSRETEISISPLGNYGKCVRFPKISPTENVVKFHHFLQFYQDALGSLIESLYNR